MMRPLDLIVISHLRWNFVWQRPQHLMSRLASDRRVFFVEEPEYCENCSPHLNITESAPNVFVCRPVSPCPEAGYSPAQLELIAPLLESLISDRKLSFYGVWFYTPMALPLLNSMSPEMVIYDCMDELSAFLNAPPQLLELEEELLQRADIVFTGGPSLFRAKQHRHHNVHCFSSSVDAAHFGKARHALEEPAEQKEIPHPRLGFFGVIDERLDINLLQDAADAQPDWQFIMVGPVVKIDPETLPKNPNIHYFGQRSYDELPHFLSGWDVCLLPFARNNATQFISPTKTLEYMAAEKPIVSTPITDVAEPYGDIVYLGGTSAVFVAACHRALTAGELERNARLRGMRDVLARTSWDATVEQMSQEMVKILALNERMEKNASLHTGVRDGRKSSISEDVLTERLTSPANDKMLQTPILIIGAGPTGLSAAYHLGDDAMLIERKNEVGGWCRSIEIDGFTFDFAGHIMFSNDPYVHEMYQVLLGDNVHWQDREAWVFSKAVYTRYPFQGALYGLPPEVIKECLTGAIEARYGHLNAAPASPAVTEKQQAAVSLSSSSSQFSSATNRLGGQVVEKSQATENGHNGTNGSAAFSFVHGPSSNGNGHVKKPSCDAGPRLMPVGDEIDDCCGDGILESTATLAKPAQPDTAPQAPASFEEFIYKVWGKGIAKHFAIPYNRKLWAVPLTEMETSWLGGRVPLPDLEEMIDGALSPVPKPMGPNARFGYPLKGGFQALMNGFLPHLKGPMRLGTEIVGFKPSRHEVTLSTGETVHYEQLISTMPLPTLVRLAGDEAPPAVREAALGLRYISVRCVHLGIGRENLTEKHWIYYPEDPVFHRIFVQGNASPSCNPEGGFGLTCEITYHSEYKPLPCDGDELIQRCIDDCRRIGIITESDPVITATQVDLPHAYVIYDHSRAQRVSLIRNWLTTQDVVLAGRYSEWEYYNSDHAFLAGKKAADKVQQIRQVASDGGGFVSDKPGTGEKLSAGKSSLSPAAGR